ncbi:hypothetical protein ACIHCQ_35110 [Streptomyces sp. NPDC052236]|uniref:hypothetical protein n=1 Tax=Streptomyces sp. NPDC052236 TaxID=3365686 RepID=UPI0037D74FA8
MDSTTARRAGRGERSDAAALRRPRAPARTRPEIAPAPLGAAVHGTPAGAALLRGGRSDPATRAAACLRLQRAVGNKAVTGLVASAYVQRQSPPESAEQLDVKWRAAVGAGEWAAAARVLNGLDNGGIVTRVAGLNHDQLIWLYTAVLGSMSGAGTERLLGPIEHRDRDAAFQACVRTAHWAEAATVLHGFNDPGIAVRTRALGPPQVDLMLAATPEALARVRSALLDVKWRAAVSAGQWAAAAQVLNGFSDDDVKARLRALTMDQILALRGAATAFPRLAPLIEIGSAPFTNTTDTGNAYTSNALVLRNGVLITKEVKFISAGTFAVGGFEALQNRMITAVTSYMTGKYKLRVGPPGGGPTTGDGDYPITVRVVPNPSATYPVTLHGGLHGRSMASAAGGNMYQLGYSGETSVPDIVLAHECGHMILGASDEYANAQLPGRVITNDHSLMGNFYTQGIAAAELKARHLKFLVTVAAGWFPGRTISIVP